MSRTTRRFATAMSALALGLTGFAGGAYDVPAPPTAPAGALLTPDMARKAHPRGLLGRLSHTR